MLGCVGRKRDSRAGDESGATTPALSGAVAGAPPAVPLTERILARLPGPRLGWVAAWALVPWLNLAVVLVLEGDDLVRNGVPVGEVLNRTAVSFAVLVSLYGAARITDELRTLRPVLVRVVEQEEPDVERLFRGIDSSLAPVLLTAAAVVVLPLDEAIGGEPVAALIQAATWLVLGIPLWTAVWVYLTLHVGLNRLGRGHLTLEEYHGDRSLGLRPVGRLAFTGFWMLFGTVGPLVITGISDVPGAVVGIGVLVAGVGLFFLSLRRLNRQMMAVKQRALERAVDLYRQAYQPVRAERIQEWPFDEATFARVVTIASSVAAVVIARIILDPVGL
jgi:hypothetical protein